MTRLFDAPLGQFHEFPKKLSIVGFTAEHLQFLMRDPHAMERWVRALDTIMADSAELVPEEQRNALVKDVFADGVLVGALKRAGVHSLSDIADWTVGELLGLRTIGDKRIDAIEVVLESHGYTFSTHEPHDPDRVLNATKSRAHPRGRIGHFGILEFVKLEDRDFIDGIFRYRLNLSVDDVRFMSDEELGKTFTPGGIHKIRSWCEANLS